MNCRVVFGAYFKFWPSKTQNKSISLNQVRVVPDPRLTGAEITSGTSSMTIFLRKDGRFVGSWNARVRRGFGVVFTCC
jgi:hypothetical protein